MKRLSWIIRIFLASPFLVDASQPDHLLPVDFSWAPKYRAVLAGKLGSSQFDYGRLIIQPAFAPEESVSLYSGPAGDPKGRCYVAYLVAEKSLWQSTDEGRYPERAGRIHRIDAEIPRNTAYVVKQAWTEMLTGRQKPRKWRHSPEMIYQDATTAEFSIQVADKVILYGETPLADDLGSNVKRLVNLYRALVTYCKARPAERLGILRAIESDARELLNGLHSPRRGSRSNE